MAKQRNWSQNVTEHSDAMDVKRGTFAERDPKRIAHELERDAAKSTRRKLPAERSALSMLTFYINRAGKNLTAAQRKVLEAAKEILRDDVRAAKPSPASKKATTTTAKTTRKKVATPKKKAATTKKEAVRRTAR